MATHVKGFEIKRERLKKAASKNDPKQSEYICSHFFYNKTRRAQVIEYAGAIEVRLYEDPEYSRQASWDDPIFKEIEAISPANIFNVLDVLKLHGFEFKHTMSNE